MHDLELLSEVWKVLRSHLIRADVEAAADDFVGLLTEHGIVPSEILQYVVGDDVLRSVIVDEDELEDDDDDDDIYEYED